MSLLYTRIWPILRCGAMPACSKKQVVILIAFFLFYGELAVAQTAYVQIWGTGVSSGYGLNVQRTEWTLTLPSATIGVLLYFSCKTATGTSKTGDYYQFRTSASTAWGTTSASKYSNAYVVLWSYTGYAEIRLVSDGVNDGDLCQGSWEYSVDRCSNGNYLDQQFLTDGNGLTSCLPCPAGTTSYPKTTLPNWQLRNILWISSLQHVPGRLLLQFTRKHSLHTLRTGLLQYH